MFRYAASSSLAFALRVWRGVRNLIGEWVMGAERAETQRLRAFSTSYGLHLFVSFRMIPLNSELVNILLHLKNNIQYGLGLVFFN
jgi:uncharacterized protein YbgA (DUF1722 family)